MSKTSQYPYLEHVKSYCRRHSLFSPGPVVVAVSGGADSLTLLHMLIQLQKHFEINVHAATFNHGIRGEAGANDVTFVKDIAAQWGVPVTSGYADVPSYAQENKLSIETAARNLRYKFLFDVAHQIGSETIAVGHNEHDQAETVLMHLLRGSGLKGLRGMLPKTHLNNGMYIVRPLLQMVRSAIDFYIKNVGITPRIDETNIDTNYARNHIRRVIFPFLIGKGGYGNIEKTLVRLADIAYEDYEALQACLPNFRVSQDSHTVVITRDEFMNLLPSQQRAFIRNAAEQLEDAQPMVSNNRFLSFSKVEIVRKQIIQGQKFSDQPLGGDSLISFNGKTITISRETYKLKHSQYPDSCPSLQVADYQLLPLSSGIFLLHDSEWQIRLERISDAIDSELLQKRDPYQVIIAIPAGAAVQFRTRQSGDRFKPHGMSGKSQKLQDTFVNMGVPAKYRDQVPLLVVNNEIAWFIAPTKSGVRSRIAETFAVRDNDTREIWRFTFFKT